MNRKGTTRSTTGCCVKEAKLSEKEENPALQKAETLMNTPWAALMDHPKPWR